MSNIQNPWKTIASEIKYDNPWITVTHHQVLNPNGNPGIYGEVHFKNFAIGIIPIDEDNNIWLIGQYRYPQKGYSWEIPEGGGNLDVSPVESAKRELLEEAGIIAHRWTKILEMHLSNSVCDEKGFMYLAQDLEFRESAPEDSEDLVVKKVPFEKAYQMVINYQITDSMSVAAILRLKIMIDEGAVKND